MSATFSISGSVRRLYRGQGGKGPYAFLTIEATGAGRYPDKFDVAVFGETYAATDGVAQGDTVNVTGHLATKKDGKRAGRDGREFDNYVVTLTAQTIEVADRPRAAATTDAARSPTAAAPPTHDNPYDGDGDIPF